MDSIWPCWKLANLNISYLPTNSCMWNKCFIKTANQKICWSPIAYPFLHIFIPTNSYGSPSSTALFWEQYNTNQGNPRAVAAHMEREPGLHLEGTLEPQGVAQSLGGYHQTASEYCVSSHLWLPSWEVGKESTCNAGDPGSIPGWERSPGEGNGNPLQYSYLGNPMDRGAWLAIVHGGFKESHNLATKPPPATCGWWGYKRLSCIASVSLDDLRCRWLKSIYIKCSHSIVNEALLQ